MAGQKWSPSFVLTSNWRARARRRQPPQGGVSMCAAAPPPRVSVFYDRAFSEGHLPPPGSRHPERPDRVRACRQRIAETFGEEQVAFRQPANPGPALRDALEKVHTVDYLDEVERLSNRGGRFGLDGDTYGDGTTYTVASLAAQAWLDAAELTMASGRPSFALTRPPGHHASRFGGSGFCIFNNAALAANEVLARSLAKSVNILDWDVHHGNGTANIVKDIDRIKMVSSHQWPDLYPCGPTGDPSYTGRLENMRNVALSGGTSFAQDYRSLFEQQVLPFVTKPEQPDLLIVSAGYDALESDEISGILLKPEDFGEMTRMLFATLGHTRVVFGLEGGYELDGLSKAVCQTIQSAVEAVDRATL